MDELRMKVYEVDYISSDKYSNNQNGEIVEVTNDSIVVRCSDGLIYIKDIAIEGKKRCLVKDYFNGVKKDSLVGKVLK
jgi:methionyl-tRNA formyltransferase